MFSLMGNCISSCKGKKGPSLDITLGILGLDNAGKTVTAKAMIGESHIDVAPTIGFSKMEFKYQKHDITMFDLGGGKNFRSVWKNYLAEMFGVVYLVDSSDLARVDECRTVLTELLEHTLVAGKPILVLANKQDKDGAMDEVDVCEHLRLEELVNQNRCPCRVVTCCATQGHGKKIDPAIKGGMDWLMGTISNNFDKYVIRVEEDVAVQREHEAKEKREKAERVRRIREERDKREKEERRLRGEPEPDSDDGMDTVDGDPFKQLNRADLDKKDAQMKEEKRRKKEADARLKGYDLAEPVKKSSSSSTHHAPRSARQSFEEVDTFHTSPELSKRFRQRSLSGGDGGNNEEEFNTKNNLSSSWYTPRKASPLDLPPAGSPRYPRGGGALDDMHIQPHNKRGLAPLAPLSRLEPLPSLADRHTMPMDSDDEAKEKKKKKRKARRNQTAPSPEHHPSENGGAMGDAYPSKHSWKTMPGQNSLSTRASKSPTLATLNESEGNGSLSARYGLMDDVFALQPIETRRTRPNADSDDDLVM